MDMNGEKRLEEIAIQEFDAFLQVTAAKGLQFVKHSAHWTESILWVLLLLTGTYLAIRDIRKTSEDFAKQETVARMLLVNSETFSLQDAIVCVNYDPRFVNVLHPLVIRYAKESNIKTVVPHVNESEIDILYKSLKVLTVVSLLENGRSHDIQAKANTLLADDDLRSLHDLFRDQNVNLAELSATVGVWLCLSVQLQIEIYSRGRLLNTTNPCRPDQISWLGAIPFISRLSSETTFCVDVSDVTSFQSLTDSVAIGLDTKGIFPEWTEPKTTEDYDVSSYIDLSGDQVSTDMTKDWLSFPTQHDCFAIDVGIDAEMRLLDRAVKRCTRSMHSLVPCHAGCTNWGYETSTCNCSKMGWQQIDRYRPPCFESMTIQEQMDCRVSLPQSLKNCFQACLNPCTLRQYRFDKLDDSCISANRHRGSSIELAPRRMTVAVFEEQLAVSVSGLFSQIGGTCGLWLGVGMFGICHALLFPIKLLLKCVRHSFLRLRHVDSATGVVSVELSTQKT